MAKSTYKDFPFLVRMRAERLGRLLLVRAPDSILRHELKILFRAGLSHKRGTKVGPGAGDEEALNWLLKILKEEGRIMNDTLNKWHGRFIELAELVATWSKDPSTKVGSVVVDRLRRVLSLGYNGFPRRIKDDARLEDRGKKLELVVHAEANALLNATSSLDGAVLYSVQVPCPECTKLIIQAGIRSVVAKQQPGQRWMESVPTLREAGVSVEIYDPESGTCSAIDL